MIKPLDVNIAMTKPATLNLSACAAPTVYENTVNYSPSGLKLNLQSFAAAKPKNCGQKLNLIG
ncbi:MAG: hypothetical protein E7Z91_00450 [Cyanobacteria bacterium SIG30]|nr:hypothetical protein [Cyanobacteria bacterium SIG30]